MQQVTEDQIKLLQTTVKEWLTDLKLSEYTELFYREGYRGGIDIANLKKLDEDQMKGMGITKRGAHNM